MDADLLGGRGVPAQVINEGKPTAQRRRQGTPMLTVVADQAAPEGLAWPEEHRRCPKDPPRSPRTSGSCPPLRFPAERRMHLKPTIPSNPTSATARAGANFEKGVLIARPDKAELRGA